MQCRCKHLLFEVACTELGTGQSVELLDRATAAIRPAIAQISS